jgi:ABC-2 type transport system permease protein
MTANIELQNVNENPRLRGFSNLLRQDNRAWWGTRRWWFNLIIWPIILCGLLANMLFVPTIASLATEADIARAGSLTAHILGMGLSVFFEFGITALAIGIVILAQDLIVGEKQSGVAEWMLSKPIARRAYILSKLVANTLPVLILLIGMPSALAYGMLSLRMGAVFPLVDFLPAIGIMALHTFFYLTLTLMLGTFFNSRGPILGLTLGSILGGGMLGGLIKLLSYITPWMLPKLASITASGQVIPVELGYAPVIATAVWCLVFILVALAKFEKMEF